MYYLAVAALLFFYVTSWYLYSQKVERLDVADEAWGLAQPYITLAAIIISGKYSIVNALLLLMTLVWGYRLFSHLHKRHRGAEHDDKRYIEMRSAWKTYPRLKSFIYVFLLQGVLAYMLGISSMILVFYSSNILNPLSLLGLGFWLFGFVFETVADQELRGFVRDPKNKGKIMDQGLWKYSRHPNYFGEVLMWWGIFAFAFLNYQSLWMLVSPLTITYLIIFVSGIPLGEKAFSGNPDWEEYKKKTSALIPLPRKK